MYGRCVRGIGTLVAPKRHSWNGNCPRSCVDRRTPKRWPSWRARCRGLPVWRLVARWAWPFPKVAVIGVANDECLCALSIRLTTWLSAEQIGYRAAVLLEEMMNGGASPGQVLIEPHGVVCRQSTDTMAVNDQVVAEAIRFIRAHACEQIHIADVANHVHMARSALARRLKQAIGRTIHDEIQRTRIARVQQMLIETRLPLKQVAGQAGFSSVQYMTRALRAETRQTPAAYRRENQM